MKALNYPCGNARCGDNKAEKASEVKGRIIPTTEVRKSQKGCKDTERTSEYSNPDKVETLCNGGKGSHVAWHNKLDAFWKRELHGAQLQTANDPKLSDCGARRGSCEGVAKKEATDVEKRPARRRRQRA